MTFVKTWDEAKPAGTRDVNLGAADITEFKYGIRERLAVDHDFQADETGITTIGYHKAIHMIDQVSDPTGNGVFYRKGDDLFYTDGSGNSVQITSGGVVNSPAFPSAISALWDGLLADIPTGWTLHTASVGKFIRAIETDTTEPGTTGGSDTHTHTIAGTHTHSASTSIGGSTVNFAGGANNHGHSASTSVDAAAPGTTTDAGSTLPAYYAFAIIKKT